MSTTLDAAIPKTSGAVAPAPTREALDAIPWVDVAGNLSAATRAGKRFLTMMREIVALRWGPGRLTMAEYFYYRLWASDSLLADKKRFVGKRAMHAMHLACNDHGGDYGVTQDKLLFQAVAAAAGLPVPPVLAIVHRTRTPTGASVLRSREAVESLLRDPGLYPFFAKPIGGIYSLGAVSGERLDATQQVHGADGSTKSVADLAAELTATPEGMLIQRRLRPAPWIAERFGNRLCSLRLLVLLTAEGPQLTRAVCKIPAPGAIADNFWRPGNMVAAVNVATGVFERVVRGSSKEMQVDFPHPQTAEQIVGACVPDWSDVLELMRRAAMLFPRVGTQSWDVALTHEGPVLLEVNWGGDLNLAQLAYGRGVLDEVYAEHLRASGYEKRRAQRRLKQLRAGLPRR